MCVCNCSCEPRSLTGQKQYRRLSGRCSVTLIASRRTRKWKNEQGQQRDGERGERKDGWAGIPKEEGGGGAGAGGGDGGRKLSERDQNWRGK